MSILYISEINIFIPINPNSIVSPYLRYTRFSIPLPITKYKERRPSIAKMFDVITIKVSLVIANTAGIESNAKARSVISTENNATNNMVAYLLPCFLTRNLV